MLRMTIALVVLACVCGCTREPPTTVPATPATPETPAIPAAPATPEPPATPTPPAVERGHYTSLAEADCKLVQVDREAGGSRSLCPGLGDYTLAVLDGDARMSIEVIAGEGPPQPLELWSVVSGAFSSLGDTAEWRLDDTGAPQALIVRFNAHEDPDAPDRTTSYLVVARLDPAGGSCATAMIAPGAGQNQQARQAADRARGQACLQPRQW